MGVDKSTLYSLNMNSFLIELSIRDKTGDEKGRISSIDLFIKTLELNLKNLHQLDLPYL